MATFKQTLKRGLFEYPTIFPNPVDVCVHLFCIIGNGYEWHEGELVDRYDRIKDNEFVESMTMRDISPMMAEIYASVEKSTGHKLKDAAQLIQMKFVEDNIDAIIDANPTNSYFGGEQGSSYFKKGICVKYAHAFDFPDDTKKDWADALYTFINHWLYVLNCEYGPGHEKDDPLAWWPADIREARKAILDARVRLHPLSCTWWTNLCRVC